jgi:hypothetical protein
MTLLGIEEVGKTLSPSIFVFHQNLNQLLVILELGIDHLYILFIFSKKIAEVLEAFLYSFG